MPARKNRPGKHGTAIPVETAIDAAKEGNLARKLMEQESKKPSEAHYVGWMDMETAESMKKKGLLETSPYSPLGCFFLTDLFKKKYL